MISDVLDEAGREIDRYLERFPYTYTGMTRQWIRSLRLQMQTVQELLDDPTFDTHDRGDVREPQSLRACPRYHVTADWPNVYAENERDAINQCFWAIADNSHRLQPAWTVEETTPSEGGTDERDDG